MHDRAEDTVGGIMERCEVEIVEKGKADTKVEKLTTEVKDLKI